MKSPTRPLIIGTIAALVASLVTAPAVAHPPTNPYDNTIFAPIRDEAGFKIGLEPVAEGLTSPLRGVLAPGESGRMYVVDQIGKLWAVDLSSGAKTVFLDVSSRLVPLGLAAMNKMMCFFIGGIGGGDRDLICLGCSRPVTPAAAPRCS